MPSSPQFWQTLTLVPMTADYARAIAAWRYTPPYDWYNGDDDLDDAITYLLNPDFHYYAVLNADGELIAFRCFGADAHVAGGDYSADALDMGGGMRPDLTGQGLGAQIMLAAMAFAREHFQPCAFRATVAAWNTRALKACFNAGYREVSRFVRHDGVEFVVVMRDSAIGDRR